MPSTARQNSTQVSSWSGGRPKRRRGRCAARPAAGRARRAPRSSKSVSNNRRPQRASTKCTMLPPGAMIAGSAAPSARRRLSKRARLQRASPRSQRRTRRRRRAGRWRRPTGRARRSARARTSRGSALTMKWMSPWPVQRHRLRAMPAGAAGSPAARSSTPSASAAARRPRTRGTRSRTARQRRRVEQAVPVSARAAARRVARARGLRCQARRAPALRGRAASASRRPRCAGSASRGTRR